MKRVTEKDLLSFAIELASKLGELYGEPLIKYGYTLNFVWGKIKWINLLDVYINKMTIEDIFENCISQEGDIEQETEWGCLAYLTGFYDFYKEIERNSTISDDPKAKELINVMNELPTKYGMNIDTDYHIQFHDKFRYRALENYIYDEYSICREERQYALFLYNILRKYHTPKKRNENSNVKNIFNACGIPTEAEIENVFYEATFMRDIFERQRRLELCQDPVISLLSKKCSPSKRKISKSRSFNALLLKYVTGTDESYTGEENNLGANSGGNDLIREMMNATPDIAVVYRENTEKYLLFIECKFESYEKPYKSGNKQCDIQWRIAEFLCNNYFDLIISPVMKDNRSRLVEFVRKLPNNNNEIRISELIDLNEEIFK